MYILKSNYGEFISGNKSVIVNKICEIKLDENKQLFVRFSKHPYSSWYEWRRFHSYDDRFSTQELWFDIIDFVFSKLIYEYGWKAYKAM